MTARHALLENLRDQVRGLEQRGGAGAPRAALPFGVAGLDAHLPAGGLVLGALHEVAPSGPELPHAAAAGLFAAGVLARLPGPVLWCLSSRDLFAPALAAVGLHPNRLLLVETYGGDASVLVVLEEGLRQSGLAGVVGEVARLSLTQSRRLQLAAEGSGVVALVLRRWREASVLLNPTAAATRWQLTALPSSPTLVGSAGVGRPRWRVEFVRARGAEPQSWILEGCDATGHLGLPADLEHGPSAARQPRAAAGR